MKPKITKTAIKKAQRFTKLLALPETLLQNQHWVWYESVKRERERERERGCTVWYEKAIKALRFECEKKDLERRKRQREKEKGKN